MRISGEIIGDPVKGVIAVKTSVSAELRGNIDIVSGILQGEFRAQVQEAGLGRRLSSAWRRKVYPAPGAETLSPAALVWSKSPSIIRAYAEGTLISGKHGQMLAIPTDLVPRAANRRLTPKEVAARFGRPLRPVRLKGGKIALILDGGFVKGSSGALRRSKLPQKKSVVMFILVRQVKVKKRLDIEGPAAAAQGDLAARG